MPFIHIDSAPAHHIAREGLLLALLLLSLSLSNNSVAQTLAPRVQPSGWVANFDYQSDLIDYLKAEYKLARQRKLTPYVYFYFDGNRHCRKLRRLMRRDDLRDAFNNTHIVMLNYSALHQRFGLSRFTRVAEARSPSIARIAANGGVEGDVLFIGHYLFHPELVDHPDYRRYRTYRRWDGSVPERIFAKQVKRYFQRDSVVSSQPPDG